MAAPVEATVADVRTLGDGLTTYERAFEAALASARSDLNRAQAEFQQRTARKQTEFERAARAADARKEELDRCEKNCGELERAYAKAIVLRDEAKRRWEKHKQALAKVESSAAELLSTISTIKGSSGQAIPRGRRQIQQYAATLDQYLKREAG